MSRRPTFSWIVRVRGFSTHLSLPHSFAHRELISHRAGSGEVRLADFGVAISTRGRTADGAAAGGGMTDVVGTPYWMAPEVIEMSGATDRSDVWSVGCTVIELLTGSPPYADLPQVPALFRIVQDLHPPLPELAAQDSVLHDFLMRCFQKDPQDRADAQSLSEHSWLIEMNQSIDETIGHDIEAAADGAKSAWSPLDEESEEDDAPSAASPPAGLVPHARAAGDISSNSISSSSSRLSRSAAASTVVSPGQQQEQQEQQDLSGNLQKQQGGGAVLPSTISRHRELSDTIRSGRSSVHGGGGRGSLRVSRSSAGSSISSTGRWEPMLAEHGNGISMTSLSSLSALASGGQPLPAAGHTASPFEVSGGTGPSDRRPDAARHQGYGRAGAEPRYDGSHPHALQAYNGSTSSYSYTQADPQKEAEHGAEEGSEAAGYGGDGPVDTAAAAAAALELDIQPQATEDWEEALDEFASSISLEAADAVDEADEDTKEARRWIEQLKAPNRSGGGSTAAGPISAVATRDDSHHQACVALVTLFIHSPAKKSCLITEHAIVALIEILEKRMEAGSEASSQLRVQVAAMILINQVTRADPIFQEKLCLVGVLPLIVQLANNATAPSFARPSQAPAGATAAREQGTAGATVVPKNGACMQISACRSLRNQHCF